MKPLLTLLLAAAALAFATACGSPSRGKSAAHIIIPAGTFGVENSWTPSEDQVREMERELARMFYAADRRITGLPDGVPPYPLSDYNIRYSGSGPAESRYIFAEAMHTSLPESARLLTMGKVILPENGGPRYLTFMYDMNRKRITNVRFNAP
ncbi:MAG: hypothetical protein LBC18_00285 [Opitutaceae bacterium]|jgi:hypothetical protein|nr:hypothetical protein [Opitutaceae bacterium]